MRPDGNYPSVRMHPGGSYPSEKMWPSRFNPTEFHPNDIHPSGFHPSKKVRLSGNFMHLESRKEWRVKSPSVASVESGKGKEKMDVDSLILGTKTFAIQQPIVHRNPTKPILAIAPKHSANDHEASTSRVKTRDPKYTQPKWCPPGLTKTQKRKLQRLRSQEMAEQEAEKQRDKLFNDTRPMVPTKQVWRPKQKQNTDASTLVAATPSPPKEDDATPITSSTPPETSPSIEETLSPIYTLEDEDEIVDYEATPVQEGMNINMVYYLPIEFRAIGEEGEVAQLDFGPKNAIFEKPREPVKHLKPLYLKGHINGSPVARMLVDGTAVVNLMPYSVFKKLGLPDEELIKTNMVLNGFEGKEKTEAKGVMYVELTVGSKTLATAFFVAEVQGNYKAY